MDAEEKQKFEPNIINSTVYIICLALQVSTFAVNYKVCMSLYFKILVYHILRVFFIPGSSIHGKFARKSFTDVFNSRIYSFGHYISAWLIA